MIDIYIYVYICETTCITGIDDDARISIMYVCMCIAEKRKKCMYVCVCILSKKEDCVCVCEI